MSRKSVLSGIRTLHLCEICGEPISHDVARVDEGRLFHLRCFRQHVAQAEAAMRECPSCSTLGRTWDWAARHWRQCVTCGGSGYLAAAEEARGA